MILIIIFIRMLIFYDATLCLDNICLKYTSLVNRLLDLGTKADFPQHGIYLSWHKIFIVFSGSKMSIG